MCREPGEDWDELTLATYRCEATSVAGFVQQLAVSYLGHGYWFYVTGRVPDGKDPAALDAKLIEKYQVGISKWAKARRKRVGGANVQYIRHGRFFVLLCSKGEHRFFRDEPNFRDVREDPIHFQGYSIGLKRGVDGRLHPSVRIHPRRYGELKAHFLEIAPRRSVEDLAKEFARVPFEPYAPVCRQLFDLLRGVNRARAARGMEVVPTGSLRLFRRIEKPFGGVETPNEMKLGGGSSCEELEVVSSAVNLR